MKYMANSHAMPMIMAGMNMNAPATMIPMVRNHGFVHTDGSTHVEIGNPERKHVQDNEKDEGDKVFESEGETLLEGCNYVKFLFHSIRC